MDKAIDVGISITQKVGVPLVSSTTTNISADISFDSTKTNTKTETQAWEIDREVSVPPHTQVDMSWTINEKQSTATFYADVVLTGYIAIWNNDKIDFNNPGGTNKHWLWFIPVEEAFKEMTEWGVSVPSLYTIGSDSVTYSASGDCKGVSGFSTTFWLKQTPLTTTKKSHKTASPRTIAQIGVPAKNT